MGGRTRFEQPLRVFVGDLKEFVEEALGDALLVLAAFGDQLVRRCDEWRDAGGWPLVRPRAPGV